MSDKRDSCSRGWDKMDPEILVKIFTLLNVMDLITSVPMVCRLWLSACSDPRIWDTTDLSVLISKSFENPQEPYAWSHGKSKDRLLHILGAVSRISNNSISNLYFNFYVRLQNKHLSLVAEKFPNLRRIVLSPYNNISLGGFLFAAQRWKFLESLTLPMFKQSANAVRIIGEHCMYLSKLRLMSPFSIELANAITTYLPHLKCLSLRCSIVQKEALNILLNREMELEVLNLSHCVFMEILRSSYGNLSLHRTLQRSVVKKASKIKTVLLCNNSNTCLICQRLSKAEFGYGQQIWLEDEVTDLAMR